MKMEDVKEKKRNWRKVLHAEVTTCVLVLLFIFFFRLFLGVRIVPSIPIVDMLCIFLLLVSGVWKHVDDYAFTAAFVATAVVMQLLAVIEFPTAWNVITAILSATLIVLGGIGMTIEYNLPNRLVICSLLVQVAVLFFPLWLWG